MKKFKKVMIIIGIIVVVIAIVALLFIKLWPAFGRGISNDDKQEYGERTTLFYDGIFHGDPEISIMNEKESQFGSKEQLIPNGDIPIHRLDSIPDASVEELKWVWFGHSSSMLQMQGLNIVIDPVFSEYASPVGGFGPKRFSEVPITYENLPEIDVLVISHDHYDHLDYNTIRNIDDKVKEYIVPLGVENHLLRWGVEEEKIHSIAWWEEVEISGLTITSTPGRHYTGRLPWQNNTTLWSGYVFQNENYQTYYTGDSGYGEHFKEVFDRFGAMDFMIVENGQYDNSWEAIHMLPEQSVQAIKDVEATWVVPVHWGTFSISYHAWDHPIQEITSIAKKEGVNVATPRIGEILDYEKIEQYQNSWWEEVE